MGVTEVNDRNWHGKIRVSGEWRHIAVWEGAFLRVKCTNDLLSIIKRETPHIISPKDGWRIVIFVTNTTSKPKGPVDILVLFKAFCSGFKSESCQKKGSRLLQFKSI